ncbi:DUF4249 domain-containing protein [Maribacter algarum]|uniref:DUF4249 domain-containing protein n=1 Tax=Maribacter algarum (ex Zhang et al. 2020) TaxID=2578118 RepID=A0A5S3PQY2_9FLAO|nr:DUF4249 domain-containing protein [Maribacter algarum]TMM57104.1 DUF4249 domain-containing protein [Maribacter algarum]
MKRIIYVISLFAFLQGCIEPFQAETQVFEDLLVVDARLTNEDKQHQILLSRARPFEQDSINPERNARVSIIEGSGTTYDFEEYEPGHYVSTMAFSGKVNQSYQLKITTSDGESYASTPEVMPENVPIGDLKVKRMLNEEGEDGVSIQIDNESLGNQPRYFRYDYQEDYEIRAPKWNPFKMVVIDSIACEDGDAYEVIIEAKNSLKGRICYGNRISTRIILAATNNLERNDIADFEVQFVARENFILSYRYSILVNQYTQSVNAHSYYRGLEDFSVSESVFSETQPGFLAGNIFSESDGEQNVIGYFETAPVSSKRIFFNYKDLFPAEPLPEYPINCENLGSPDLVAPGYHCSDGAFGFCDGSCISPLIELIRADEIIFAAENEAEFSFNNPFLVLLKPCGDCTVYGSDIKPDFWIE